MATALGKTPRVRPDPYRNRQKNDSPTQRNLGEIQVARFIMYSNTRCVGRLFQVTQSLLRDRAVIRFALLKKHMDELS
jgi:hypothetical protein